MERRRSSYLVFGAPMVEEPEIAEVVDSLRSGWLSTGPKVDRFEELFKQHTGSRYVKAVNSCTAGLHLSLLVSGIGPGDEVIVPPMTFAATANVVVHVGARPVFVDVDRTTMNIDPVAIEAAITPRTRGIIPVHFAGRPCDMDQILAVARRHDLVVIEDAAHAIESSYHGRKVGTMGDLGCFSFYVTKNLVTGEGGMITTDREDWAIELERWALHGLSKGAWKRYSDDGFKHYEVVHPGYKYNMMDLQAALGIHQIGRLERYHARREEIWKVYDDAFADLPVFTPSPAEPDTVHGRHLYTLLMDLDSLGRTRDDVQRALHEDNIGTGIHFTALHLHPYYRDTFGYVRGDYPNAEWISDRTLSLPMSAALTDEDVEDVIAAVTRACASTAAGART
jgi:dTDP-4-amino-4,6-dideoxygalactose transaminase